MKCESRVKWTMATRSRYRSFTAKEKLRIIEEAENIGNRAAGRKYDVRESYIRDWCKKKTNCDLQRRIVGLIVGHFAERKRGIMSLKKKRLCNYMDDKRQYGYTVTSEMCKLKALAIPRN